jgi:hypothetical protein
MALLRYLLKGMSLYQEDSHQWLTTDLTWCNRALSECCRQQCAYFALTSSSSSNLHLYLGGAGMVGLVTYVYLYGSAALFSTTSMTPATKPSPKVCTGPWHDLNLKAIKQYFTNTTPHALSSSCCTALSPLSSSDTPMPHHLTRRASLSSAPSTLH